MCGKQRLRSARHSLRHPRRSAHCSPLVPPLGWQHGITATPTWRRSSSHPQSARSAASHCAAHSPLKPHPQASSLRSTPSTAGCSDTQAAIAAHGTTLRTRCVRQTSTHKEAHGQRMSEYTAVAAIACLRLPCICSFLLLLCSAVVQWVPSIARRLHRHVANCSDWACSTFSSSMRHICA